MLFHSSTMRRGGDTRSIITSKFDLIDLVRDFDLLSLLHIIVTSELTSSGWVKVGLGFTSQKWWEEYEYEVKLIATFAERLPC